MRVLLARSGDDTPGRREMSTGSVYSGEPSPRKGEAHGDEEEGSQAEAPDPCPEADEEAREEGQADSRRLPRRHGRVPYRGVRAGDRLPEAGARRPGAGPLRRPRRYGHARGAADR